MARRVRRNLPAQAWRDVADPRGRQGRRYTLPELLQALVLGMVTGAVTLRDVENLVADLASAHHFGVAGSPSDTTLERIIRLVDPAGLRPVLHRQVLGMHRSKQLGVLPDIGISLVAIDGKTIGTDRVRKHPEAQPQGTGDAERFFLRTLRAVHVGSAVKPVLDQVVIPVGDGEANTFVPFMEALLATFGRTDLFECVTVDAAFTGRFNMHWLNDQGIGFIAALKGDQPTLHDEARRILGEGDREPEDGWELQTEDVTGSRSTTRWFARTREMVGWHDWTCIRQVWRVRQRVEQGSKVTWTDRYFLTNLPWGRLGPRRCLAAVRAHWGIENDANWTLDTVWKEDQRAWVRMDKALETLAVIRLLAYNLIRMLRHRALRSDDGDLMPFRRLLQVVRIAITTSWEPATGFG